MAQSQAAGPIRPSRTEPTMVGDLCAAVSARLVAGAPDTTVTGVTLRAQSVQPGDVFAALPGSRFHGARFAADAIAAGALAIYTDDAGAQMLDDPAAAGVAVLVHDDPRAALGPLSSAVYGDPSTRLTLIGITGTSGKTTTAFMVESILLAAGRSVGLLGTVETRINGVAQPSSLTTPEAPDLQALFAAMVEQGVDTVVMEVSSHALALGRVAGSDFDIGGFTNLSQDHLDFHPTMRDYFAAKAMLFAPDSPVAASRAVICVDDDWGREMASVAPDRVTVSTGATDADWRAGESTAAADGTQTVTVTGPDGVGSVLSLCLHLGLPGRFNVANAALATAITRAAGVSADAVVAGLARVSVPGRLERVDTGQDFLAVVDYAHKPAALEAVLATLRGQTDGRIAVVIGAGGDRDTGKRVHMGAAAARGAEFVVITDDNPRTENPAGIRSAVLEGAVGVDASQRPANAEPVVEAGDRRAAIEAAVGWAGPGDVVLVAGKGHETGQEIDGVKHPFDDRVVLAEAMRPAATVTVADARVLLRQLVAQAADAGVGSAHREAGARTWLIVGDLAPDAGAGEQQTVVDHDALGRLAVRLAVDKIVCVGASRAVRALHQGAVMEGSWGEEAVIVDSVDDLRALRDADPQWRPGPGDMAVVAGPPNVMSLTDELSRAGLVIVGG